MNSELENAKKLLYELSEYDELEKALLEKYDYLPKQCDVGLCNENLALINDYIHKAQNILDEYISLNKTEQANEISLEIKKLEEQKKVFQQYKDLVSHKETIYMEIVLTVKVAKDLAYDEIVEIKNDQFINIDELLDRICLASSKIRKPFMVALLIFDPNDIYLEVINNSDLTDKQKVNIRKYIEFQKRRIDTNLVLSDKALINLLESNTGRNIIKEESKNSVERYLCNKFCVTLYRCGIIKALETKSEITIYNDFNTLSEFKKLPVEEQKKINSYLHYIKQNLTKEKQIQHRLLIEKNDEYDKIHSYASDVYTLGGGNKKIVRYSDSGNFLRTDLDIRAGDFPVSEIDERIFSSFKSLPKVRKKYLISIILDNLKLCYDLYYNYYKSGNYNMSTYLTLSNDPDNKIELNYNLEENNLPHILGIPPTHDKSGNLNMPTRTLNFLGLSTLKKTNALQVLNKILEKTDDIIENSGLINDSGTFYSLLPWEKIILKTNAFIRGDFFKSVSIISPINPSSYLIKPGDGINRIALNATNFSNSVVNQSSPVISDFTNLFNSSKITLNTNYESSDMIIKGMMATMTEEIKRIDAVITNESNIGERITTKNGTKIRTLNKVRGLLEDVNPSDIGIVISVENEESSRFYLLDEQISLLEQLALNFANSKSIREITIGIIEQLKGFNHGYNKKS